MKNILIVSKPDDADSVLVSLHLQQLGHYPVIWFPSDTPSQLTSTFQLNDSGYTQWKIRGQHDESVPEHIDSVWLRRPRQPVIPKTLHEDDREIVTIENKMFYDLCWYSIAKNAFWVNPIASIRNSTSKLLQLEVARELNFKTPDTIISNDPIEIKKFIGKYPEVIYKPMRSHFWQNGARIRVSYTNTVTLDDLPSDSLLQLTPGIFQPKINKKYELRVNFFGSYYVAVKVDSQQHEKGKLDWRNIPQPAVKLEQVEIPEKTHQQCVALLKHFNLNMGCIDFIVTEDNDYYFLEINEQGQFLWIEESLPDIPLLDIFTQFLISQKFDFKYEPNQHRTSIKSLHNEAKALLTLNKQQHQATGYY